MVRPRRDHELERIAETVRDGASRPELYRWLRSRHDPFAELLAEGRPNWAALAAKFAELGIMGGGGQPVTAETARHTWWRCRRDVAKARAKRGPGAPPLIVPVSPRPIPPTPAAAAPLTGNAAVEKVRAEMLSRSGKG